MKHKTLAAGYDQEEAHFYKKDQELIAKMRERPKLTLIQGGKSDKPVGAKPAQSGRKAA